MIGGESHIDIFNNNGIIMEHLHHNYLASKVPQRRNKDYKARFRNYVAGFPVYKKDCYSRHYYNLVDILQEQNAPMVRYTKSFLSHFLIGTLLSGLMKSLGNTKGKLEGHMANMHINNYTKTSFSKMIRVAFKTNFKFGMAFGGYFLAYQVIYDQLV